jgi:HicB family
MDLNEYAESLRRELVGITRFASEDVSKAAEMLAESLDSSVRLSLLNVLSAAADEITLRLEDAAIDVRLNGTEPEFVVIVTHDHDEDEGPSEPVDAGDDAGQTRITLRLPESLKAKVESSAAATGMSVNAWLVHAISRAVDSPMGSRRAKKGPTVGKRYTGYARS